LVDGLQLHGENSGRRKKKENPICIIHLFTNKRQGQKLSRLVPNTLAAGRQAGENSGIPGKKQEKTCLPGAKKWQRHGRQDGQSKGGVVQRSFVANGCTIFGGLAKIASLRRSGIPFNLIFRTLLDKARQKI
jgi:hypothetical protein